jgi:hypothetical protein
MTEGPLFAPPADRPLPDRLTVQALRQAIIDVLYDVKAYDLAGDCVFFGLEPPASPDDRPEYSKRRYVDARVRRKTLAELLPVAEKIAAEHDDRVLAHLLALASGTGGVRGELKNLIFAPLGGPKPKIVLADALNNDLELTENSGGCLVYDRPLAESGLTWRQLTAWWAGDDNLDGEDEQARGRELYRRLAASLDNGAEKFFFVRYCARYQSSGFGSPALIPQVYLHYDPYTRHRGGTLARQRMDFLLLLPGHRRVVLEVDGIHHYADRQTRIADPALYAQMAAADRKLRLAGYEVYRFGGQELADKRVAGPMLDEFFASLLSHEGVR